MIIVDKAYIIHRESLSASIHEEGLKFITLDNQIC